MGSASGSKQVSLTPYIAPRFPKCKKLCRLRAQSYWLDNEAFSVRLVAATGRRLVLAGLIIVAGLYVLSAFFAPLGWRWCWRSPPGRFISVSTWRCRPNGAAISRR